MDVKRPTGVWMMRTLVVLPLFAVGIGVAFRQLDLGAVNAQDANVSVIRAEFKTTRFLAARDAEPIEIEQGVYFIAPYGSYRIETLDRHTGDWLAEIVDPVASRRIKLDVAGKRATIGSNTAVWQGPSSAPRPFPGGPPSGLSIDSQWTSLGTREVFGLTLEGELQTNHFHGQGRSFVHTMELWSLHFENPRIPPVLVERRFVSPEEIVERRIDGVMTIQGTRGMFEVPPGYSVTRLPR